MFNRSNEKNLLRRSLKLANVMTIIVYVIAVLASTLTFVSKKSDLVGVRELVILFLSIIPTLFVFVLSRKIINELIMYLSILATFLLYFVCAYTLRENPNIFIIFYALMTTSLLFIKKKAVIFSTVFVAFALTYFTFVIPVDVPPERLFGVVLIRYVVCFQLSIISLFCAHSIYSTMVISFTKEKEAKDLSANLKETLSDVAKVSEDIFNSSRELLENEMSLSALMSEVASSTEEIAEGMEHASSSINKINNSGQEIGVSLFELSGETERISQSAKEVEKRALSVQQDSESSRDNAISLYNNIQDQVLNSIDQTNVVEEISDLSSNIANIAEQINLLALNASIEAARAGEQGKGFAVVANEVRQLASDSTITASQIQKSIEKIQVSISNLVSSSSNLLKFINEDIIKDYDKMVGIGKHYKSDSDAIAILVGKITGNVKSISEHVSGINKSISETAININSSAQASKEITVRSETSEKLRTALNRISQTMNEKSGQLNLLIEKYMDK